MSPSSGPPRAEARQPSDHADRVVPHTVAERKQPSPAGARSASVPALFLFLDGVGIGTDDATRNAFMAAELPRLDALLGGKVIEGATPEPGAAASLAPLDATLGVPGIPQSGTGHAALLTGQDAIRMHGRHFGPWVPVKLRPLVRDENLLAEARAHGRAVTFANAYPLDVIAADRVALAAGKRPRLLRAGPPLAADGAGVLERGPELLASGQAVASEITNDMWARRVGRRMAPPISPYDAGANLARIAAEHDLTLYAHYATDRAGHERTLAGAIAALEKVDTFLAGLLDTASDPMLVIVASDHGNIEDTTAEHTMNPALGLVIGPNHAQVAAGLRDITDVTPALLRSIGVRRPR